MNGIYYYGKSRTARSGGSWLQNLQWCPNGQPDYGIDKIRSDQIFLSHQTRLLVGCLLTLLLNPFLRVNGKSRLCEDLLCKYFVNVNVIVKKTKTAATTTTTKDVHPFESDTKGHSSSLTFLLTGLLAEGRKSTRQWTEK